MLKFFCCFNFNTYIRIAKKSNCKSVRFYDEKNIFPSLLFLLLLLFLSYHLRTNKKWTQATTNFVKALLILVTIVKLVSSSTIKWACPTRTFKPLLAIRKAPTSTSMLEFVSITAVHRNGLMVSISGKTLFKSLLHLLIKSHQSFPFFQSVVNNFF